MERLATPLDNHWKQVAAEDSHGRCFLACCPVVPMGRLESEEDAFQYYVSHSPDVVDFAFGDTQDIQLRCISCCPVWGDIQAKKQREIERRDSQRGHKEIQLPKCPKKKKKKIKKPKEPSVPTSPLGYDFDWCNRLDFCTQSADTTEDDEGEVGWSNDDDDAPGPPAPSSPLMGSPSSVAEFSSSSVALDNDGGSLETERSNAIDRTPHEKPSIPPSSSAPWAVSLQIHAHAPRVSLDDVAVPFRFHPAEPPQRHLGLRDGTALCH